jgi:predicted Zn-dependent peptidase
VTGTVVSVVDEIRGLKQLLDDGILTEEEFTKKKKQLLGV